MIERLTHPGWLSALVGLAAALWVALLPTQHLTPDAVNNLQFIEAGDGFELWHSQHLLAQWPGYWTYWLPGGSMRAYTAIRAAHVVLAGVTVALTVAAAFALTGSRRSAVLSGLALLFSYGFWHYASDPDIYLPGYAAVALLLLTCIRYLRQPTTRRAGHLTLAAALAILLHQLNLETAGLIGLTLLWFAWRRQIAPGHVGLYAAGSLLIPAALYGVGWRAVVAWQVANGQPPLDFAGWALRYFETADAGAATWGVSLSPETLPVALYAWLQTWLIAPLSLARQWPGYWPLLAVTLTAGAALLAHAAWVLGRTVVGGRANRSADADRRGGSRTAAVQDAETGFIFVCTATLLANFVSGWWWQAGNLKFYLFMQLHLILLLALYAAQPVRYPRLRRIGFGALLGGLIAAQVLVAIPFERRGGVFAVRDRFPDPAAQQIAFDEAWQAVILRYISDHDPAVLPPDFCTAPPPITPGAPTIWVVRADRAADCPSLSEAAPLDRYQARREADWWTIYRVDEAVTARAESAGRSYRRAAAAASRR